MQYWIITIFVILTCIVVSYLLIKNINKKLEKLLICTNNTKKKTCYICKVCGCPCFDGDNMCPDCLESIPKDYF